MGDHRQLVASLTSILKISGDKLHPNESFLFLIAISTATYSRSMGNS